MDKKEEFGKKKQLLAKYSKAISHPARIAILRKLAEDGKCNCGQIVESLPLSQSTVSQHLRELKAAGLINTVNKGPSTLFSLNKESISIFIHEFKRLANNLKAK